MGSEMAGWVDTILTVLFVLIGALMTFFILLQEGKGGGLAALGGTKAAGVEGVTNPIRRATGYLAGLFFALAIILGVMHKPDTSVKFATPASTAGAASTEKKSDAAAPVVTPTPEAPKTEAPKTEEKKPEAPKTEEKKPEAPKTDEKKADEAKPVEKKEGAAVPAAPAAPAKTETK